MAASVSVAGSAPAVTRITADKVEAEGAAPIPSVLSMIIPPLAGAEAIANSPASQASRDKKMIHFSPVFLALREPAASASPTRAVSDGSGEGGHQVGQRDDDGGQGGRHLLPAVPGPPVGDQGAREQRDHPGGGGYADGTPPQPGQDSRKGEIAGTRALFFLGGLASIAFGAVLFARPDIGAVTMALLFGLFNLTYGTWTLVQGIELRRVRNTPRSASREQVAA